MRSNRPNYASTPAGSAKAFDQKPKPKRSKREINQLMLMLFFIVLPVLGLLAIFFQPIRWVFMLAVVPRWPQCGSSMRSSFRGA